MIDLTDNKHIKTINEISLPRFRLGAVVNTPIGYGIVVKCPSLDFDGSRIHELYNPLYTVYFGMDEDKVNKDFKSEDEDLIHERNKWISKTFYENELEKPNRFTPTIITSKEELSKHTEAVNWDNWRDSLAKQNK